MSSATIRERDTDDEDLTRSPKRTKVSDVLEPDTVAPTETGEQADSDVVPTLPRAKASVEDESVLPPSHVLLGIPSPTLSADGLRQVLESDVGISEYIGRDVPPISGIIKQRFTDFLVYEVDQDHQVVHIKSLDKPESSSKKTKVAQSDDADAAASPPAGESTSMEGVEETSPAHPTEAPPHESTAATNPEGQPLDGEKDKNKNLSTTENDLSWGERHETSLKAFFSEDAITQLKQMYLEGPEPPRTSDSGWGSRVPKTTEGDDATGTSDAPVPQEGNAESSEKGERGKRDRNRGTRGGRGGRGRGRGGRFGNEREDHRKILSEPMSDKSTRTALHKAVRELFGGKLESETDMSTPAGDDGSRIVIKWSRRGGGRGGGRGGRSERPERGTYPPYIHFTLQKTNRDTQDALGHISRTLHVNIKDLAVAGTKDKRGVTVQRVSLRRGAKTVEDVWKAANQIGRRSARDAVSQRGDRGVRIADLCYRKASLELGMLKGNAFVITLRNVQTDSVHTLDRAMNSIKHKGFINYYGMQRFGTAAVPTHSIGLAILKSDWHKAVALILQKRPGEHPDVVQAREAWLIDGNLDHAIALMPRRVVAERCILESYKKQGGDTRNAMGALSTIPRNLRLMYVHAYQSYVWNAIVSERIRMHGSDKAVPGDLVFESEPAGKSGDLDDEEMGLAGQPDADEKVGEEPESTSSRARKKAAKAAWVPPSVKTLTEEDADKYSIFDVIMPLPGRDVAYPGGKLGERYREFLILDGLDPDNFIRKQKEYTLNGSYRKILQLPKDMSWSVLRYTDPDVALAQADEDKLLGFDAPVVVEDGKFVALQINLTLGTAAYATMALREVTKTETSSHFQTGLTQASEDQQFRGTVTVDEPEGEEPDEEQEMAESA
ncbi:tRNA pseudouridine synthase D [Leucogyrophana mollusca]|uniref:tRNA pseudouridine synthase D n=1 Tax=Leucogyrophana mollusca TaxID=85980 RepID=A0ACB8BU20_9AGAM|nr:tRNA pseudouridine synthase D [Leucogyrophana mollusca]